MSILSPVIAIAITVVLGAILFAILGTNPIVALYVYFIEPLTQLWTLEELVEQLTWVQLGRHRKPVLLANIEGFWEPLCALLDHMKTLEFIRPDPGFELMVADKVADILPMLQKAAETVPEAATRLATEAAEKL